MQVHNLTKDSEEYTSNVWDICGTYYTLSDLNTLIDVGRDPMILPLLGSKKCGLGKRPVEQIILTHSHFDHAGMIPAILEQYHVPVYAHPECRIGGIIPLSNRQRIRVGEHECLVVFTPGHSNDSVCILCEEEHTLFSGDSPMRIYSHDGEFLPEFIDAFELFVASELRVVYPGHGDPLEELVPHLMEESLRNIHLSRISIHGDS